MKRGKERGVGREKREKQGKREKREKRESKRQKKKEKRRKLGLFFRLIYNFLMKFVTFAQASLILKYI